MCIVNTLKNLCLIWPLFPSLGFGRKELRGGRQEQGQARAR